MSVREATPTASVFERVLELAHHHLGLDVAWISEFRGGGHELRAVAGDGESFGGAAPGAVLDHTTTYCARVVAGALPYAVPDVRSDPRTRDMPVTSALDVGAYIGVPVVLPGGETYGMLCSLGHAAAPLDERDVKLLRLLAEILASEVHQDEIAAREREDRRGRVRQAAAGHGLRMVFQPIVHLETMTVCGAEALARFESEPRNPALWFSEAAMLDMAVELDIAAIRSALERLDELPEDAYLSLNASPATVVSAQLHEVLATVPGERILLEITEQAAIADYDPVVTALRALREAHGIRVAVDDAGAGYASLNHILRLRPDVIKLDVALTRGVDADATRQALARALVEFGRSIGATIVAEGVETQAELDMLVWLGVTCGQGYFLARPGELPLPRVDAVPASRVRSAGGALLPAHAADGDEEAFVRAVLAEVIELTGLESSYLTFYDGDRLEHRWVHNAGELEVPEPFTIPYEESLCHRCREAGLIWTAAVPADIPGCGLADAAGIQTFASVPVASAGAAGPATLCALGREPRYLGADALERLEALATAISERLAGA